MTKVLLIYPPLDNHIQGMLSARILATSGAPPIQLLLLAAQLDSLKDVTVKVIDCRTDQIGHSQLSKMIAEFSPDIVGITTNTFMLIDALLTAENVKKINKDTVVVMGGVHPTLYPKQSIKYNNIDYIVRGEAEWTFKTMVQRISEKQPVDDIPGVITRQTANPESIPSQIIENLDEIRPPAWHYLDIKKYSRQGKPVVFLMTSRGCPGKCTFCHISSYKRSYRFHSAKYVYDHLIEMLAKSQLNEFFIADDCFTVNHKRVIEFCQLLINNNVKARWGAATRIDTVDDELLKVMAQAGCTSLYLGIETGDQAMQKKIQKNINLEKAKKVIAAAQRYGMNPHGFMMIGMPGETEVEIKNTINYIRSVQLSGLVFGAAVFQPYPFTTAYLQGLASGLIKEDYWLKFAENPTPSFKYLCWNEHFTTAELMRWRKKVNNSFYFRPIIIYRTIKEAFKTGRLLAKFQNLFVYLRDLFDSHQKEGEQASTAVQK